MKIFYYILVLILFLTTAFAAVKQPKMHKVFRIDEKIVQKRTPVKTETKEEIVKWNKWHSEVLNEFMKTAKSAPESQPVGTLTNIEFNVDNQRNVTDIKINTEPAQYSQEAKNYFSKYIRELNGNPVLDFPDGSQRKVTHFKAGVVKSNYTKYSKPEDFRDTEIIKE